MSRDQSTPAACADGLEPHQPAISLSLRPSVRSARAAGIFGYSRLTGDYAGGQAEYARAPYADVGPLKLDDDLSDEQVLFLSDILPTGYMGAEFCDIEGGEVIAVFGAGPVCQFAIASAVMLGAERVIAATRCATPSRLPAGRHRLDHRRLRRADGQVPDRRDIDPSFVVTHRLELGKAPDAYETFKHEQDDCMKVVLKP